MYIILLTLNVLTIVDIFVPFVYFRQAHAVKENFAKVAQETNAILCMERTYYLAEFKSEQVVAFDKKVTDLIDEASIESVDDDAKNHLKIWRKCDLKGGELNRFGHGHSFYKLYEKL